MSKMGTATGRDITYADEIQHIALSFMVESANAFYSMPPADRVRVLKAISTLVEALDAFPRELEPHAICSKQGKLLVTFNGAPARPPIVVEMP